METVRDAVAADTQLYQDVLLYKVTTVLHGAKVYVLSEPCMYVPAVVVNATRIHCDPPVPVGHNASGTNLLEVLGSPQIY